MLNLPNSTLFNKRIPKQRFYENLSVTPELKRAFTEQIATIYWRNKIAPSTLNIAPGERVDELQVFELHLHQADIDSRVLQLMDREIPYHILFLLMHDGLCQARMGYKEASQAKSSQFVVSKYYQTEWLEPEKLALKLDGLTMDAVYDNFLRQIGGERLIDMGEAEAAPVDLKEAVVRDAQREKLRRQIASLEKKVRNEKQFNRQVELNAQLKQLKSELEAI